MNNLGEEIMNERHNSLYPLIKAGIPAGMHQLHMVTFSFPKNVSTEQQIELMAECKQLFYDCGGMDVGIVSIDIVKNLDSRKGFVWVEIAIFESAEAFIAFHSHPKHEAFGKKMANIADQWIVIDIPIQTDSQIKL